MTVETKKKLKFTFYTSALGVVLVVFAVVLAFSLLEEQEKSQKIIAQRVDVAGIPVVEIYKADGIENKPLIVLQHGFKNKKEAMIELGEVLAEEGFFVIAPDAYAHGERKEGPLSLVEIIVETSQDYDEIFNSYENDNRVELDKLGMSGFSMGGCICFHYAVNGEYKPQVMAPTITTPYFEQLIGTNLGKSIYNSEQGVRIEENQQEIDRINHFIVESSPFPSYVNLLGIDMLIQNGADDTYVSSEGVEKLKIAFEKEENQGFVVDFISVPGIKHKVNGKMKARIVDFMVQNLMS